MGERKLRSAVWETTDKYGTERLFYVADYDDTAAQVDPDSSGVWVWTAWESDRDGGKRLDTGFAKDAATARARATGALEKAGVEFPAEPEEFPAEPEAGLTAADRLKVKSGWSPRNAPRATRRDYDYEGADEDTAAEATWRVERDDYTWIVYQSDRELHKPGPVVVARGQAPTERAAQAAADAALQAAGVDVPDPVTMPSVGPWSDGTGPALGRRDYSGALPSLAADVHRKGAGYGYNDAYADGYANATANAIGVLKECAATIATLDPDLLAVLAVPADAALRLACLRLERAQRATERKASSPDGERK